MKRYYRRFEKSVNIVRLVAIEESTDKASDV